MIIEGAIGDAYGAGFEFADQAKIKAKNNVSQYETHPLFEELNGKYTDDTQMSIGIAELLLEEKDWNPLLIANKFVEVFKRDPRRGYAKRFYQFLLNIKNGKELLDKIIAKSDRNGAAMRAYPIGILRDENEIIEKCDMQSSITHQTEKALVSAQAVALINHYFIYQKGAKSNLIEYLKDFQKYKWKGNWKGPVRADAIETVEAVLSIIIKEYSLTAMLKKSVDYGGDVDTVASIVLAVGKMSTEIEDDLPTWLHKNLENDEYGYGFLKELDKKLLSKVEYNLH